MACAESALHPCHPQPEGPRLQLVLVDFILPLFTESREELEGIGTPELGS